MSIYYIAYCWVWSAVKSRVHQLVEITLKLVSRHHFCKRFNRLGQPATLSDVTALINSGKTKSSNIDPFPIAYSNYRPISNLPYVSKLLERQVSAQLRLHLQNNNIEDPFQSAYRPSHSVETAIVCIQDDVLQSLDSRRHVALVLLDLPQCCVRHDWSLHPSWGITPNRRVRWRTSLDVGLPHRPNTVCQCWRSPILWDTAATRSPPGQRVGPPTLLCIPVLCWPAGSVLKAWYPISRICGWHAVIRRRPAWRFCVSCRPDTPLCYRR